jgi:hypothetical protein
VHFCFTLNHQDHAPSSGSHCNHHRKLIDSQTGKTRNSPENPYQNLLQVNNLLALSFFPLHDSPIKIETVKSDCIPMQSLKKETFYEDKYLRFKRDNKAVHS